MPSPTMATGGDDPDVNSDGLVDGGVKRNGVGIDRLETVNCERLHQQAVRVLHPCEQLLFRFGICRIYGLSRFGNSCFKAK